MLLYSHYKYLIPDIRCMDITPHMRLTILRYFYSKSVVTDQKFADENDEITKSWGPGGGGRGRVFESLDKQEASGAHVLDHANH